MAYARFGKESDVYAFEHIGGFFLCECCRIVGRLSSEDWPYFETDTRTGMIEHLREHRRAGDRVPDEAFARIEAEIKEYGEGTEPIDLAEMREQARREKKQAN